jgi:hypothetical protein
LRVLGEQLFRHFALETALVDRGYECSQLIE